MGASESASIRLSFNRSNSFYYAGEMINGSISAAHISNKIDVQDVRVEFIGELTHPESATRWIENDHGRAHKEQYIEPNRVVFWSAEIPVMRSSQGKKSFALGGSSQAWSFQVHLPESLPPSLTAATERDPHVKYYARILLDKQNPSRGTTPIYPLTISPRVHLSSISGAQESVSFTRHNRKHIDFNGSLLCGGILPGQNLSLQFELQNPKRAEIKRIDATLVQHRQIAGVRTDQIIFRNTLPGVYKFQETSLQQYVDLLVPHGYLPPTHTFTTLGPGTSVTVFVHYELIFKVKVTGVFSDFHVNIPVIVGTESSSSARQQYHGKDLSTTSKKDGSDFNDEDMPPSYEVAIGSSK